MQATFYKADAHAEGRGVAKEITESTLYNDTKFAARAVGEHSSLVNGRCDGEQFLSNLLRETADKSEYCYGWGTELFCQCAMVVAIAIEFVEFCPLEIDLMPVCQHCQTRDFVLWSGIFVTLWFTNLYLFVLLASKGFTFSLKAPLAAYSTANDKDIPQQAVTAFLGTAGSVAVWWLFGLAELMLSDVCDYGHTVGRSPVMLAGVICCLIAAPVLMLFGRHMV
eukprot:TRINITY_DN102016_c0_g1_i1.p1 TRINITY_DN102016_c0_g1~~TRINITY_DN102016_c0_g1_i1.p1  ORF type:complete len:223 (-),score=35.44 TRINITY_DN102016_c0_g1_i1:29-697(-)